MPKLAPATLPGLSEADGLASLTPADADRFRLLVERDPDGFDGPLEWGGLTCVPLSLAYGYLRDRDTPDEGADPLDLRRVLDRLGSGVTVADRYQPASDRIADAAIRWARIFHGRTVARWNVGLDQSTYVDGLVYWDDPAEDTEPDLSTLTQWGRGEVYTVTLQRLIDAESDDWDDVDVLGGSYFDEGWDRRDADPDLYGPAQVAAEHFGVTLEFARAVEVVDR